MATAKLTDRAINNTKPGAKVRKVSDGGGLSLLTHPNGSKYFQLRYSLNGKPRTLQLGKYPDLTLAEARNKAQQARKLVVKGVDPVQQKRIDKATQAKASGATFQTIAEEWLTIKKRSLAPTTHRKIGETFSRNIYPHLGKLPLDAITAPLVRDTLQIMELRGALEIMWKCRAWMRAVFTHAENEGLIGRNPIPERDDVLTKHVGKPMASLKSREDAGQFIRSLHDYPGRISHCAAWVQTLL